MNWGKFLLFIVIGFAAQIIDGTLGMAYGVSCRTFLKTVAGLPSALASAVVHVAEVPTTLASGLSHIKLKNVDKSLFFHLAIPGVIGGVAGRVVPLERRRRARARSSTPISSSWASLFCARRS